MTFRTFLSATAISAMAATGALAQTATTTDTTTDMSTDTEVTQSADTADMAKHDMTSGKLIRTRDITGGTIYTMNEADDEWSMDTRYDAVGDGWNDIGEIEDVVLDSTGQMIGVVGEIGGFLDIADKHVMIPLENVRLVPVDDAKYALVTDRSEEELEALEEVDEGFWQ